MRRQGVDKRIKKDVIVIKTANDMCVIDDAAAIVEARAMQQIPCSVVAWVNRTLYFGVASMHDRLHHYYDTTHST